MEEVIDILDDIVGETGITDIIINDMISMEHYERFKRTLSIIDKSHYTIDKDEQKSLLTYVDKYKLHNKSYTTMNDIRFNNLDTSWYIHHDELKIVSCVYDTLTNMNKKWVNIIKWYPGSSLGPNLDEIIYKREFYVYSSYNFDVLW